MSFSYFLFQWTWWWFLFSIDDTSIEGKVEKVSYIYKKFLHRLNTKRKMNNRVIIKRCNNNCPNVMMSSCIPPIVSYSSHPELVSICHLSEPFEIFWYRIEVEQINVVLKFPKSVLEPKFIDPLRFRVGPHSSWLFILTRKDRRMADVHGWDLEMSSILNTKKLIFIPIYRKILKL